MSLSDAEWFTEAYEDRTAFSVRYSRKLFDRVSSFQRIEIFETEPMGRVLVLDGCFMLTDKDHFVYHEMIAHPAMAVLPNPRKALVIGGGDGGVVTELVKYPQLESVTLCEIDPLVVSACREYFPAISAGLADQRVQVINEDGAAYIAQFEGEFDLVIVDSTDPVGPGTVLFEVPFYQAVRKSLTSDGAAVFQTESPLFMEANFLLAVGNLKRAFGAGQVRPYLATIPCYPGGLWSFSFCSERRDPIREAPDTVDRALMERLSYYNAEIHRGAFALPLFVQRLIGRVA
jgi:spermidine synthase